MKNTKKDYFVIVVNSDDNNSLGVDCGRVLCG